MPARARPRPCLRRGDLGDFPCAGVPRPVLDSGSGRASPRAPGRARPSPPRLQVRSRVLRRSLASGPCGSLCSRVADTAGVPGRGLPSIAGRRLIPAPVVPPGRSFTHTPSPRGLTTSVAPGPCMESPARVGPTVGLSRTWCQSTPLRARTATGVWAPLPSPGLRASRPVTLERSGRPARPRLVQRRITFGHPLSGPDVCALLPPWPVPTHLGGPLRP